MMRIRVLRMICHKGSAIEPGTVLYLPDHEALEDIHRGVVERVEPAPASSGPLTTESVPELVQGKAQSAENEREDAQEQ